MQQHRFEPSILHALPSSSPPPIAFQQITSPALLPRSTFSPHRPSPPCCYRVWLSFSIARVFSASTHFSPSFEIFEAGVCSLYPNQMFLFPAVLSWPDLLILGGSTPTRSFLFLAQEARDGRNRNAICENPPWRIGLSQKSRSSGANSDLDFEQTRYVGKWFLYQVVCKLYFPSIFQSGLTQ